MFDKESNYEGGRGLIRGRPLDPNQPYLSLPSIFDSPLCSAALLSSSPRAEHSREIEIRMKELEPLEENFRDLNQRLQKMGYKLVKSDLYGWYWWR